MFYKNGDLQKALDDCDCEKVSMLLRTFFSPNRAVSFAERQQPKTPLHYVLNRGSADCLANGRYPEMLALLLDLGSDLSLADYEGKDAAAIACDTINRVRHQKDVSPEINCESAYSALLETLYMLIARGADKKSTAALTPEAATDYATYADSRRARDPDYKEDYDCEFML